MKITVPQGIKRDIAPASLQFRRAPTVLGETPFQPPAVSLELSLSLDTRCCPQRRYGHCVFARTRGHGRAAETNVRRDVMCQSVPL